MSSGEPEYDQQTYIAAREQEVYDQNRGHFAAVHGIEGMAKDARQQANQAAAQYGHHQAQVLSQNHRLWDKPTELGTTYYLSYPHKELARFVQEDFDPAAVHEVGRYYNKVGNEFIEFAGQIREATLKTEQNWQGRAGDAMRTKMTDLSGHLGHTGEGAQLTGNQTGMQAESAERARNSMPEVIEVDVAAETRRIAQIQDQQVAQQEANALEAKQAKAQAAHEEAARVVSTMESDFGDAANNTPKFAPPPPPPSEDGGSAGQFTANNSGVGTFTSPSSSSGSGYTGSASTYSASATPSTATPSTATPTTGSSYTSTPSSSNAPASTSSSWANSGSSPVRGPGGLLYKQGPDGHWLRQNSANGNWAPVPRGQAVPGGRAGTPAGGGSTTSGGRPGSGSGSGTRGSTPTTPSPGGQSGSKTPGTPRTAAPTTSTASSASSARGGRMPMAPMGANNQQGGDEEEHENKYAMRTDEAMDELGVERVAPPVLGALPWEEGGDNT